MFDSVEVQCVLQRLMPLIRFVAQKPKCKKNVAQNKYHLKQVELLNQAGMKLNT